MRSLRPNPFRRLHHPWRHRSSASGDQDGRQCRRDLSSLQQRDRHNDCEQAALGVRLPDLDRREQGLRKHLGGEQVHPRVLQHVGTCRISGLRTCEFVSHLFQKIWKSCFSRIASRTTSCLESIMNPARPTSSAIEEITSTHSTWTTRKKNGSYMILNISVFLYSIVYLILFLINSNMFFLVLYTPLLSVLSQYSHFLHFSS